MKEQKISERVDFRTSKYIKQNLEYYTNRMGKTKTSIINDLLYKWIQEQKEKDSD
jgi:predicted DNA-binding protein